MKRVFMPGIILMLGTGQVCAQQATAVGTGIGVSKSTAISSSRSTAISGQGGAGGAGGTGVGVGTGGNVTIAGAPSATTTTVNTTGTSAVKTVPSVFAPGLAAAGLETCLGSVSVGASWLGTGLTGGGSIPDAGCAARLDARTLWAMGLKKAAVARLCLNPDIYRSMPDVCTTYLPVAPTAVAIAPVVAPVRYDPYGDVPYSGGDIWLSHDGGPQRLCHDYDAPRQRCRVWAGVVTHRSSAKKRIKSDVLPGNTAAQPAPTGAIEKDKS